MMRNPGKGAGKRTVGRAGDVAFYPCEGDAAPIR